jgi:GntR family transcriptional regulator, rspAB operon transcriptional repressor
MDVHVASTISDSIYGAIKTAIIELKYKPGEKLSESRLAKSFNVSRAPVRDALRKLQEEELVLVRPQIGTIVTPISQQKAKNICQIRLLLEPYAARIAAGRSENHDFRELEERFNYLQDGHCDKEEFEKAVFELDTKLHQTIWELSQNEEIYTILDGYKWYIQRIRLTTAEMAGRLTPSLREMKAIYQALSMGNEEKTYKAMYDHILNISNAVETFTSEEDE